MTIGTVYYNPLYARSNWLVALGEYLDLPLQGKNVNSSPEFAKLFPLKRTPAFISPDGFKLTETLAITFYLVNKSSKPEFAGKTIEEKANNWRWYSFITSDMINLVVSIVEAKNVEDKEAFLADLHSNFKYIDDSLSKTDFLTGDSLLVCDIFARSFFLMLTEFKIDYSDYHNISKYIEVVAPHPIFSKILKK